MACAFGRGVLFTTCKPSNHVLLAAVVRDCRRQPRPICILSPVYGFHAIMTAANSSLTVCREDCWRGALALQDGLTMRRHCLSTPGEVKGETNRLPRQAAQYNTPAVQYTSAPSRSWFSAEARTSGEGHLHRNTNRRKTAPGQVCVRFASTQSGQAHLILLPCMQK